MSLISIALKGFVYINRCERCFIWLNICFAGDISSTSKRSTWLVIIIKKKVCPDRPNIFWMTQKFLQSLHDWSSQKYLPNSLSTLWHGLNLDTTKWYKRENCYLPFSWKGWNTSCRLNMTRFLLFHFLMECDLPCLALRFLLLSHNEDVGRGTWIKFF